MACIDQCVTDRYAIYNGDCCEVMAAIPDKSVHLSIYSPPFGGLYRYSSSERDLSNARTYEEFFAHYEFVVAEIARVTIPGRMTVVHAMDVPKDGANYCGSIDFPGDIIRLHERLGFEYVNRITIWKEPLGVRNRTMAKHLAHKTIVEDATLCSIAAPDFLLQFRKRGTNPIPVAYPDGFLHYVGAKEMPHDLLRFRGMKGDQKLNKFSHWIWRNYASPVWDDIRIGRVLPYLDTDDAGEEDKEKHPHPLQLDVIERCVQLWSNADETVLTPFMGPGSEPVGSLTNGRKAIGIELKPAYYRQAIANIEAALNPVFVGVQTSFLDRLEPATAEIGDEA